MSRLWRRRMLCSWKTKQNDGDEWMKYDDDADDVLFLLNCDWVQRWTEEPLWTVWRPITVERTFSNVTNARKLKLYIQCLTVHNAISHLINLQNWQDICSPILGRSHTGTWLEDCLIIFIVINLLCHSTYVLIYLIRFTFFMGELWGALNGNISQLTAVPRGGESLL